MEDNLLIQNNTLKRIASKSNSLGAADTIVSASTTKAYGIAELLISTSANATFTVKIGADTVLEFYLAANDSQHFKFYERLLVEASPAKNKTISVTTVGTGTYKLTGTYLEISNV